MLLQKKQAIHRTPEQIKRHYEIEKVFNFAVPKQLPAVDAFRCTLRLPRFTGLKPDSAIMSDSSAQAGCYPRSCK